MDMISLVIVSTSVHYGRKYIWDVTVSNSVDYGCMYDSNCE